MSKSELKKKTTPICLIKENDGYYRYGVYRIRLDGDYEWNGNVIGADEPMVAYARKVVSGEYLACENEKLGCARMLADLERMDTEGFPYVYDTTRAERIYRYMSCCANVDGLVGEMLEIRDDQAYDLGNIFGWVHKDTGIRRFTEALVYMARGQGKSSECAVVSNYGLTSDCWYPPYHPEERAYENEPNVVTLAVDKKQCKEVRECAMSMARMSPEIAGRVDVRKTYIRGKERGGEITAVSKETGNLDGGKISIIICDEWAAQKEEQRLVTLRGSFGKKRQCLLIKITTAGLDCAVKPAFADYDRCCGILRGLFAADRYYISIREMEKDDRIDDWAMYEKCAPCLRRKDEYAKRLLEMVQAEYHAAFDNGTETAKIEYLTKRTNRWQVAAEDKFLNVDDFEHLRKSMVESGVFGDMIRGRSCGVGVDLSKNTDISALAFVFNLGDGRIAVKVHGFMPKESLSKHLKTDKVPYQAYVNAGYITLIEGTYIDTKVIEDWICDYAKENDLSIKYIATDPAFAANFLNNMSEGRNKNGESYECYEVRQTTTVLNEPTDLFKVKLGADELVIEENELYVLHATNAYVSYDNGGQKKVVKKNAQSPARIDLLAATIFGFKHIGLLDGETLVESILKGTFSF